MPSPACMRQSEVTAVDHGIGQVNLLRSVLVLHRKGDRKAGGQKHGTLLRGLDLCYQISAEGELIYLDLTFAVCGQGSASTGGREVNAVTALGERHCLSLAVGNDKGHAGQRFTGAVLLFDGEASVFDRLFVVGSEGKSKIVVPGGIGCGSPGLLL